MARPFVSALVALSCFAVAAGGLYWTFGKKHPENDAEVTGSIDPIVNTVGPSGLPIPRFVSLKTEKVNVRKGPSSDHDVAWVYQVKGLPVEIIAEFETWRRIRDSEGTEGWILQNMLAGKRNALVEPWKKNELTPLYSSTNLQSSWLANLAQCRGQARQPHLARTCECFGGLSLTTPGYRLGIAWVSPAYNLRTACF